MAYRRKMSRKANKRNFRKGNKVKKKNYSHGVMRGGIRL